MKRQWRIRREDVVVPDGQQRWDRAYQALLSWTVPGTVEPALKVPGGATTEWEGVHEPRDLRAGFDAAAGTNPDD